MTRLLSQIHIAQPIEKVFAYVTTAESWPKWHPASLLVEGAIDHSAQVGEQIIEQIKVGGLRDCVVWTVLEHEPPRRWVFEGKGDRGGLAKISYTLVEQDGGTLFEREFAYKSKHSPKPLTIEEEAALAFAACGITGHALAELPVEEGNLLESGSGNILIHLAGRTVASGDAVHCVIVFVIDDDGVWMLKRPQDFPRAEIAGLAQAAREHRFVALYEKSRVRISDKRLDIPRELPYVPAFNKWSANLPGCTYFLPVSELSGFYNGDALVKPFCPPYYHSMEEAVLAFVDYKFAEGTGTFRDGGAATAWKDGAKIQAGTPGYSDHAIAATIAYCEYIYNRYGRFPANSGPFRTVLAYQAHHLDPDFYTAFYKPESYEKTQ